MTCLSPAARPPSTTRGGRGLSSQSACCFEGLDASGQLGDHESEFGADLGGDGEDDGGDVRELVFGDLAVTAVQRVVKAGAEVVCVHAAHARAGPLPGEDCL